MNRHVEQMLACLRPNELALVLNKKTKNMNYTIKPRLLLILAAALLLAGCLPNPSDFAKDSPTLAPVRASSGVLVEGRVMPIDDITLTIPSGGAIASLAPEGAHVKTGDLLIQLDDAAQRAALAQAEAGLALAQANLAKLEEGARSVDIESARTGVSAAEANLVVAKDQAASAQAAVVSAEAQVTQAQAALDDLKAGATPEEIQAAQLAVEQAQNSHWGAQAVRDGVNGAVDRGQAQDYDLDQAEANVGVAWVAWKMAQNQLAIIEAGPRSGAIAQAQAALSLVKAGVSQANLAARTAQSQVAVAEAGLEQAQSQVAAIKAAASEADMQAAQAAVRQAEAHVAAAQAALGPMAITAPIDGVVTDLLVKAGTQVGPGTPALVVADQSAWDIQSEDLTEMEVVKIATGDSVTVIADALPDTQLSGTITAIDPQHVIRQGDVTYKVHVRLAETDPRLRWGMTVLIRTQ